MNTKVTNKLNGVDLDQLTGTINAIQEKPELARFQFRAHNEWVNGAHSRTEIKGFYGAGQEDSSRTEPFIVEGDEPPVLLGKNAAPNAVESVLHALASCLAVGFAYNAAAQGITIDSLEFELEGDLDLHRFLGLSQDVRAGYNNVEIKYRIKADAPRERIKELCEYIKDTSPVLDIVRNPVPVKVSLVD